MEEFLKNDFLQLIDSLFTELHKAKGTYAVQIASKIEKAYNEHIKEIEKKAIENAVEKVSIPEATEEEINEIMEVLGFPEIEHKTEVHEDEYKGTDLEGFPPEVVEWMLENQVKQGNKRDIEVFKEHTTACRLNKGFTWGKTKEGFDFCYDVILDKRFDIFFKKYPKK